MNLSSLNRNLVFAECELEATVEILLWVDPHHTILLWDCLRDLLHINTLPCLCCALKPYDIFPSFIVGCILILSLMITRYGHFPQITTISFIHLNAY